jgi:hypothetical protein
MTLAQSSPASVSPFSVEVAHGCAQVFDDRQFLVSGAQLAQIGKAKEGLAAVLTILLAEGPAFTLGSVRQGLLQAGEILTLEIDRQLDDVADAANENLSG